MLDFKLQNFPRFNIIGHRGAAGIAPENTQASFIAAKNAGLNWVEYDTQLCGSNEWVVIHDETVDRTTNGKGKVSEIPYETLKNLDAGHWFDIQYQNERILLLQDVFQTLSDLNLHSNIEIKGEFQDIQRDSDHFLNLLKQYWSSQSLLPLISSFNLEFLLALKSKAPHLPLGYLVEDWDESHIRQVINNNFVSLHCNYEAIDFSYLSRTKIYQQIPILAYTVNCPEIAKHLFEQGISAIFTDNPLGVNSSSFS